MKPWKAVIVDDEAQSAEALEHLLTRYYSQKVAVVARAESVDEAIKAINRHQPHLVFLDIEMPGRNGFGLLEYYHSDSFRVVFTTAYEQYALEAIKKHAYDYLLKPVNHVELGDVIRRYTREQEQMATDRTRERLINQLHASTESYSKLALPTLYGYQLENHQVITHVTAEENYSRVYTIDKREILVSRNLGELAKLLPAGLFFRIHKSSVVNLNYVATYHRGSRHYITLTNGIELDVAQRRTEEFARRILGNDHPDS